MSDDELKELVTRNEAMCSMLIGITKAMEYGLRVLVASHPNPDLLNHTWQDLLSDLPDFHLDTKAPNPDMFHAGMQAALATLTGQIELAARS